MHKKGQAALEFLMTYGWAILVVLAAIAALAYFGVLSPNKFLPERCIIEAGSGLSCPDHSVSGNNITLQIQNGAGFDMSNFTISLSDGCTGSDSIAALSDGDKNNFKIECTNGLTSGVKIKSPITVTYMNIQSGLPHTKTGELITKVP